MASRGLHAKAKRQAFCNIFGAQYQCVSFEPGRPTGHKFFVPFHCKNRYCPDCGPVIFRELFAKYVRLKEVVGRLVPHWPCRDRKPECVVAKIDFTSKNLGRMPTADEVRAFNKAIRRFFRLVEKRFGLARKDYGVLWCDEFGGKGNTNLHAHSMYAGPWLPNKKKQLASLWRKACQGTPFEGSFIVSIKPARSFEAGLAHALKYAGKFLSKDPERLADLERAFHRVRRVHTLAAFYNAVLRDNPAAAIDHELVCPICNAALIRVGPWRPIQFLVADGCRPLDEVRRQEGRAKVLGGPRDRSA
jgi:hypothetical protein